MRNYFLVAQNHYYDLGIFNRNDDGSNIGHARIIVEFGIIGYLLFLYFLYNTKIKIRKKISDEKLKFLIIINYVSLLFIFLNLLRNGFYINPPTIFFIALSVVSKIKFKQNATIKIK